MVIKLDLEPAKAQASHDRKSAFNRKRAVYHKTPNYRIDGGEISNTQAKVKRATFLRKQLLSLASNDLLGGLIN